MADKETAGKPSYEQARDELAEVVKRLEAGGLTLEESLNLWERGERLAAICEEWLEEPARGWPRPSTGPRTATPPHPSSPLRGSGAGRGRRGRGQLPVLLLRPQEAARTASSS